MITLFYFVFEGNFQVEAPWGLYSEGRFCVTSFGGGGVYLEGFIHGGAYLRNFTLPVGVILDPGGGGEHPYETDGDARRKF